MNLRLLIVLALTALTVSACIVVPGDRGHGDYYRGDYGRRVWHE